MNRPHHPALVCEGPGEWSLRQWAHGRDERRVLAEPWPFGDGPGSWSVPAPAYHPAQEHRAERYAAQAALYARDVYYRPAPSGRFGAQLEDARHLNQWRHR